MKAPTVKKIEKKLTKHNDTRVDEYYWLNDRENKDVIEYLNAENKYTQNKLKHTEALQEEVMLKLLGV